MRRSFKGDKRTSSTSSGNSVATSPVLQSGLKSAIATVPPKKIIRALYDYTSQGPGELGFKKGDFLYVVGHEDDQDWYEACDPPSNLRGMVPVSYFEVVSRKETINTIPLSDARRQSHTMGSSSSGRGSQELAFKSNSAISDVSAAVSRTSSINNKGNNPNGVAASPLYGVVLYNFEAERQDELQASAGESIIVIAQSNDEWFVAKPIGRLGGPGLIPVSYVQIREVGSDRPVEDIQGAIQRAGVPKVEEWKRMAAEYKASSIPLGRFEDDASTRMSRQLNAMNLAGSTTASASTTNITNSARLSNGPHVISASVDRYAFDGGRYWYLVVVQLSNNSWRNLCRYYQDFYDFQIKLLDEFPDEAGRTGRKRILPFMPGPLTYVNDSISSQRRANLDDYVRKLVLLPAHISRSPIVQQLFALRAGDIETPHQTNAMPQPPLSGRESQSSDGYDEAQAGQDLIRSSSTAASYATESEEQQYYVDKLQVAEVQSFVPSTNASHSRMASDSTVTAVRVVDDSQKNKDRLHNVVDEQQNDLLEGRQPEVGVIGAGDGDVYKNSSQQENIAAQESSSISQQAVNNNDNNNGNLEDNHHSERPIMAPTQDGVTNTPNGNPSSHEIIPSKAPQESSNVSTPISTTNLKPDSVIKVKVHHEDDLIAMRVPSSITFRALVERIKDRLHLATVLLMHKEESSGALKEVGNDDDLAEVLGIKNKLVLYAK